MIKETIDIFKILANTPLPTILVIAGLISLFLAVIGKIEGHINLTTTRQKLIGVIGTLLLTLGIILFILQGMKSDSVTQGVFPPPTPTGAVSTPTATPSQTAIATPVPKPTTTPIPTAIPTSIPKPTATPISQPTKILKLLPTATPKPTPTAMLIIETPKLLTPNNEYPKWIDGRAVKYAEDKACQEPGSERRWSGVRWGKVRVAGVNTPDVGYIYYTICQGKQVIAAWMLSPDNANPKIPDEKYRCLRQYGNDKNFCFELNE